MRITVPDAAAFIDYYVGKLDPGTAKIFRAGHSRFHGTRMDVVNSAFRWRHQHFYMYDEETLRLLLEEVGFVEVKRHGFLQSDLDELGRRDSGLRDSGLRNPGTLYMDARKPAAEQPGTAEEGA
jgi:hypothetical protein